jgi:hypothetical protein
MSGQRSLTSWRLRIHSRAWFALRTIATRPLLPALVAEAAQRKDWAEQLDVRRIRSWRPGVAPTAGRARNAEYK